MNAAGILPKQKYPNGKPRKPTVAERQEAERNKANAERQHAASQPHRKGKPDPLSPLLENAFGTFCVQHKIREEWHRAGEAYRAIFRSWKIVKDSPGVIRGFGASGDMDPELALKITFDMGMAERALNRAGKDCKPALNRVIIDNLTPEDSDTSPIIEALGALAIHFGTMPARR